MVDQLLLGPGVDQKYRRPARSSVSSDQQLCLLHLWYRTGRPLSSLCRSTLSVESGRPNCDHSKSPRILPNGLRRGHGGSPDKRSLCPLNSILSPLPPPLLCSSHPPKCEQPSPSYLSPRRRKKRRVVMVASSLGLKVDLALQLRFLKVSESMGNHDSKIVDAGGVD
jgi:hypothetical protein